jgi:hypothetical protein
VALAHFSWMNTEQWWKVYSRGNQKSVIENLAVVPLFSNNAFGNKSHRIGPQAVGSNTASDHSIYSVV